MEPANSRSFDVTNTTNINTWNVLGSRSPWIIFGVIVSMLVVSFLISNGIAFYVQIRQDQRIRQKTIALTTKSRSSSNNTTELDEKEPLPRVPVTILTGFLGAGKTTLLNRILQAPKLPFKIMVLENEIGTISIDHELLSQGTVNKELSQDGIYVLQNGCMCCTASKSKSTQSELEKVLDYLLRIVNEQGYDYLLVETTGLADPGPIIETFLQLRSSRFRLDGIVTMVDTLAVQRFYSIQTNSYVFPIELERQLLYADVVALNKTDLVVDESDVNRVQQVITQRYNPTAVVYRCVNAELALDYILGIHTFDSVRFRIQNGSENGSRQLLSAKHTHGIQTFHLQVHGKVDLTKFTAWLNCVTAEYARSHILRIKGILAMANNTRRCVLQCVLETYTLAPTTPWEKDQPIISQLVIIGKLLDKDKLKRGFYDCLVTTEDDEVSCTQETTTKKKKKTTKNE